MSRLRSITEVPEPFQQIFKEYPFFNVIQSTVLDDILYSSVSVVITAPTGSGKTVLFELAIVKELMGLSDFRTFKAVYVAPVKALCKERFCDWSRRFGPLGISCIEVTGDSYDEPDLEGHQIILTTPEKWDSLTRRWKDKIGLVLMVKLLMIDEVHLLRDVKRGPVIENIVCRMKTMMRVLKNEGSVRFIGVSATIFNIEDLAAWFGSNSEPALFHRFGNDVRPVALKRIIKGFPQGKNQSSFLYDIQLSYKLKPILMEHSNGKPVLIFCSTRRGVMQTSKVLSDQLAFQFLPEHKQELLRAAGQITDNKLRELVYSGIGCHHAGLVHQDRNLVQDLFMHGSLPILVATSTLAMGVNLPAHLVIIKSTHQYVAGRVEEYPDSTVLQMVGRAGRPQFDNSATAVIITKPSLVDHYEKLLDCKEVLESSLHLQLAENLNSEIVLLTITDLSVAMEWLRYTFLYERALKNPTYYGIRFAEGNLVKIEKSLENMVLKEINALTREGLVEMNENGLDISPTPDGRLMSHYYINLHTFRLFSEVKDISTIKDIINLLADSNELSEIQLRVNERRTLNELNICKNKETIRFPMKGKINSRVMKINCLVQACLGCLNIQDPSLYQEALRVVSILERITKCLAQYLLRRNWYIAYLSAILLAKCLHSRLWENSVYVVRQLDRIGPSLSSALVSFGKTTFEALGQTHPHELDRILNRTASMGHVLIEQIKRLPQYSVIAEVMEKNQKHCNLLITISITNALLVAQNNTAGPFHSLTVIVGDTDNKLIHTRQIPDSTLLCNHLQFVVGIQNPLPQKVFIHAISNQWVGIDVNYSIVLNPFASASVDSNSYIFSKIGCNVDKVPQAQSKKIIETCQLGNSVYWKRSADDEANKRQPSKFPRKLTNKVVKAQEEPVFEEAIFDSPPPEVTESIINENLQCCFDLEFTQTEQNIVPLKKLENSSNLNEKSDKIFEEDESVGLISLQEGEFSNILSQCGNRNKIASPNYFVNGENRVLEPFCWSSHENVEENRISFQSFHSKVTKESSCSTEDINNTKFRDYQVLMNNEHLKMSNPQSSNTNDEGSCSTHSLMEITNNNSTICEDLDGPCKSSEFNSKNFTLQSISDNKKNCNSPINAMSDTFRVIEDIEERDNINAGYSSCCVADTAVDINFSCVDSLKNDYYDKMKNVNNNQEISNLNCLETDSSYHSPNDHKIFNESDTSAGALFNENCRTFESAEDKWKREKVTPLSTEQSRVNENIFNYSASLSPDFDYEFNTNQGQHFLVSDATNIYREVETDKSENFTSVDRSNVTITPPEIAPLYQTLNFESNNSPGTYYYQHSPESDILSTCKSHLCEDNNFQNHNPEESESYYESYSDGNDYNTSLSRSVLVDDNTNNIREKMRSIKDFTYLEEGGESENRTEYSSLKDILELARKAKLKFTGISQDQQ